MTTSEIFLRTLQSVGLLFASGAVLILILGRFNFKTILSGELGARYIGWLILTPIYVVALFSNHTIGVLIVCLGMILSVQEYGRATHLKKMEIVFLYGSAIITVITVLWKPALFAALPVAVLFVLTAMPILQNNPTRLYGRVRLISWGYIYTIWTLAHSILMFKLSDGRGMLVIIIVGCALADIGAYVVGKSIGRRVIASEINPRKAWEGIVGNIIGASIAMTIFGYMIPDFAIPIQLVTVLIIGIGSSWGDIISSMAKRVVDIKDWGQIIPGHGGVLDRLNSLIVVLPLVYYFLVIILY